MSAECIGFPAKRSCVSYNEITKYTEFCDKANHAETEKPLTTVLWLDCKQKIQALAANHMADLC